MTVDIEHAALIERISADEATWALTWCFQDGAGGGAPVTTEVHLWRRSACAFSDAPDGALPPVEVCRALKHWLVARHGGRCESCDGHGRLHGITGVTFRCADCDGQGVGDERDMQEAA